MVMNERVINVDMNIFIVMKSRGVIFDIVVWGVIELIKVFMKSGVKVFDNEFRVLLVWINWLFLLLLLFKRFSIGLIIVFSIYI